MNIIIFCVSAYTLYKLLSLFVIMSTLRKKGKSLEYLRKLMGWDHSYFLYNLKGLKVQSSGWDQAGFSQ